jgi:nucleoporin POM152
LFDFFQYLRAHNNSTTRYGKKWLFVDFMFVVVLARLRIPRLNYRKAVVLLQIASLWFLDGLLFGGVTLNMAYGPGLPERSSTMDNLSAFNSIVVLRP